MNTSHEEAVQLDALLHFFLLFLRPVIQINAAFIMLGSGTPQSSWLFKSENLYILVIT